MKDKEFSTSVLFVCLTNLAIFAFFCYLAVYFNHWWIALFSIILHNSIDIGTKNSSEEDEEYEPHQIQCDFCGELLNVEDVENCVHREMRQQGWKRALVNKEWKDICPYCFSQLEEAYKFVKDDIEESKGGDS